MKLTQSELKGIIGDDNELYTVLEDSLIGVRGITSRRLCIVEHKNGRYFSVRYHLDVEDGIQDVEQLVEVRRKSKTITVWEPI